MTDARLDLIDSDPQIAAVPAAATRTSTERSLPVGERWLVPVMWVAIGVYASLTTPEPAGDLPTGQLVVAEILGWAALIAIVGMVSAAAASRPTSLYRWSLGMGAVGLVGLATCQMFGHPVFSSAWGLSQVALVSGGLAVTGRLATHAAH